MQLHVTQNRYPQSVSDGQPDEQTVLRHALASGNAGKYCCLLFPKWPTKICL